LNWSKWIRQIHRWLSIAFTLCVLANVVVNFVVSGQEKVALWVGLVTLVPLTGLYLFVLPYSSKGRSGRRTAE
jgi:cellulose synthase/poly-beta-1,6-N-acetylglucosamine synthase-like glycosyltransferase